MRGEVLLIALAECRAMPWKNGGGVTREILVCGDEARFDWRLSVADIVHDGPFSRFPDHRRTLTLIEGEELRLAFDDGEERVVRPLQPLEFDGARHVVGRRVNGSVRAFNVFSARRRGHTVQVADTFPFRLSASPLTHTLAVFCVRGELALRGPRTHAVSPGQTLFVHEDSARWREIDASAGSVALVMRLQAQSAATFR